MPHSSPAGKAWIARRLSAVTHAHHVLDIGAGAGTYHSLFSSLLPEARWTGVEAWQPYIEQFHLSDRYRTLIVEDARNIDFLQFEAVDICFCGDVLEHMHLTEAVHLTSTLIKVCKLLFVSVPIGYYPQGPVGGNPYERHLVEHFTDELMRQSFGHIIDGHISSHGSWNIGVYALTADSQVAANIIEAANA